MPPKDHTRPSDRGPASTSLANTVLVYSDAESACGQTSYSSSIQHTSDTTPQWGSPSSETSTPTNGLQSLWQSFRQRGISEAATTIILQSWSAGTQKQYQPYIEKWQQFCAERETNSYDPPLNVVLDFLVKLYEQDLEYTTINTARSAISAIALPKGTSTIGSHPIISRLMKGIYRLKPPRPRYQTTWDVQPVLTYLSSLGTAENMDLKTLSLKLVMLVALVSAQRGQSLHMLDITFMRQAESKFEFRLPEHVKQSRPGYTPPPIVLHAFPSDETLCVFRHMQAYIERTKLLRGNETKLFVSYMKPHHQISKDSISRWIRQTMANAGIDTSIFKPHSTRSAATSKAKMASVPIQDILDKAGWSSSRTFDKFYNKPTSSEQTFATAILSSK